MTISPILIIDKVLILVALRYYVYAYRTVQDNKLVFEPLSFFSPFPPCFEICSPFSPLITDPSIIARQTCIHRNYARGNYCIMQSFTGILTITRTNHSYKLPCLILTRSHDETYTTNVQWDLPRL